MPFRRITFFILVSLLPSYVFSQKISVDVYIENKINKPQNDTVYYDFNRKLTWQDFRGAVPTGAKWGAMTASGFSFNSEMEDDGDNHIVISIGVYTFFTKHDSWKKPDINSAYHLEHEQHHFDITRLFAQKFSDEIRNAHFTKGNYRKLLYSIFDKVYEESVAYQHQYDNETKNSMDVQKQKEWNEKISAEVNKLKSNIAPH